MKNMKIFLRRSRKRIKQIKSLSKSYHTKIKNLQKTIKRHKVQPLLYLVDSIGSWKDKYTEKLSLRSGLFLNELRSIGVSEEKLPMALTIMLSLYFGPQDAEVMNWLVPSVDTINGALDLNSTLTKESLKNEIDSDNVIGINILPDESEKKKSHMMLKLISVQEKSGRVYLTALNTDITATKKADAGAQHLFESLLEQLGGGTICKVLGGTSDWLGKGKMPRKVLNLIDELAHERENKNPGEMVTVSETIPV